VIAWSFTTCAWLLRISKAAYTSPYYYLWTTCNLQLLDARHCQAQAHQLCHLISLASAPTLANPYLSANREQRAVRHCSKQEVLRILITLQKPASRLS